MSFFCLRLLNCASSVTSRSPRASMLFSRPAFKSTKNGLFIVWNETPKSRPDFSGALVASDLLPQPIGNIARLHIETKLNVKVLIFIVDR